MEAQGVGQAGGGNLSNVARVEPSLVAPSPDSVEARATDEADDHDEARGVLRLLMAGHFRGVADVRLRINFHEELAALETAAARAAAEEAVADVTGAVSARLEELLQSDELTEDQQTAAASFGEDFAQAAADAPSTDDVAGALNAAFDGLLASLTDLLTPEPADEGAASFGDFVAGLQEAFAAATAGLAETLSGEQALPPLSPPNGNGTAYAKFLAAYNDLRGIAGPAGEPPPETDVGDPVE